MNKVYACSDLHGMYNLWAQIRDFCDETDTIYFLGDAADRGPDGIRIMQELLQDSRVKYLKGNHEDMLVTCMSEYLMGQSNNLSWWIGNGGSLTYDTLIKMSDTELEIFIKKIDSLPRSEWYESPAGHRVFLTHAGTDLEFTEWELHTFFGRKEAYLWDRKHFGSGRPEGEEWKNVFQVHGHTPVQTERMIWRLKNPATPETIFYDEHKYNIDMGAIWSCKAALIDLDTFETKYFYDMETFKETCI